MVKWFLAWILFFCMGCGDYSSTHSSDVRGVGSQIVDLFRLPPVKTTRELVDTARRVRVRVATPAFSTLATSSPKMGLQKIIGAELLESGGVSRSQLETVLKNLLKSDDCAGVPCSRVFALEGRETAGFLDDFRARVRESAVTGADGSKARYEVLLSSLTPESEIIMGKKIQGQSGSNAGGFFKGLDGIERYVKIYHDPAQAHGEHLTGMIYRDLGIPAPKTRVFAFQNGQSFASEIIPSAKPIRNQYSRDDAREILKGFVADVLTANWDVVGMIGDNIVKGADGKFYRIDNGGAFLMRATNGRKPSSLLHQITEWDVFMDKRKNPSYGDLVAKAGFSKSEFENLVKVAFKDIESLRSQYGDWSEYVRQKMPEFDGTDAETIVSMLEKRTSLLKEKIARMP